MSPLNLPERASYEYLKKLAKDWLVRPAVATARRRSWPTRSWRSRGVYGFPSWRALKAEIDRRRAPNVAEFMRACTAGDVEALRELLQRDPGLVRERLFGGTTALHAAARHPAAVRLLLEHGADANARDIGDNASPLHFAAANRILESVRLLLDAGADVHGTGDLHKGDVIGWAASEGNDDVINLLLASAGRVITSFRRWRCAIAISSRSSSKRIRIVCCGAVRASRTSRRPCTRRSRPRMDSGSSPDGPTMPCSNCSSSLALISRPPMTKAGRRSRWRCCAAIAKRSALLKAAGAKVPLTAQPASTASTASTAPTASTASTVPMAPDESTAPEAAPAVNMELRAAMSSAAASVKKASPMFWVRDVPATVRWYRSIGFQVHDEYEDGGELVFARLTFGNSEITLSPGGSPGPRDVSLWFIRRAHSGTLRPAQGAPAPCRATCRGCRR